MKAIKWIVPALAFSLAAAGCILISGQFLIDFDLDDFTTTTDSQVTRQDVDLNENSDYTDHKDDLKAIADIAVLGTLKNNTNANIGVEVWMTPGLTTYTTSTEVNNNATKLWGPFVVLANGTKTVDWDESAKIFTTTGKAMLLNEIKGDGEFTVYAVGDAATYNVDVTNGVLALVLDFGK